MKIRRNRNEPLRYTPKGRREKEKKQEHLEKIKEKRNQNGNRSMKDLDERLTALEDYLGI